MARYVGSLLLAMCLTASTALTDTWRFEPTVREQVFVFGKVRTVVTVDARQNQRSPKFRLEVFNAGKRVALIPGIAVEQVFASPDNSLFLGLSNSGIPGTAAIVFTAEGEVRLLATHSIAKFEYCSRSVTIERVWYDSANPSVRFVLEGTQPNQGIFLRGCGGKELELLGTVQQAMGKAAAVR